MSGQFLILDGHSLAYRAFHALPAENFITTGGQHTNAVYGFLSMLAGVLRERQPAHIAVAFDVSRETFRKAAYPEYKATRAKTPPEFAGQVEAIKEVLTALGIAIVAADGYEADDVIATLATHADNPVLIVTGDRDSLQLINPQVTVLYPRKGMSDLAELTPDAVVEKYGVTPERYRDLAALVGESSDNLPGVPGVGPKTAAKWIAEYGGIENLLAVADQVPGKVGQALQEHREAVQRNYELNRLVTDVQIEQNESAYLRSPINKTALHEILDRLEIQALRGRLLDSGDVQDEVVGETWTIAAEELTGADLKKWLAKPGLVAVSFAGSWAKGQGEITLVGLARADGTGAWAPATDKELTSWLSSDAQKVVHDGKWAIKSLLTERIQIGGIVDDTALSAYLLSPGQRAYDLPSVVQRTLRRELPAADSGQLDFGAAGSDLALAARATLDLHSALAAQVVAANAKSLLDEIELPTMTVLAQMEQDGIAVDAAMLDELDVWFAAQAAQAEKAAHDAAGHSFNLGSPKQLQEVLFVERKLPKTKKIKTGYTTDADALLWLLSKVPDDQLLTGLLRYRETTKLRQAVGTLRAAVGTDGRIHTTFNQMVAATGRLSSVDPNLQNIPVRTEEGNRIRSAFIAGAGYNNLLTADYSQIELRVMAHLSKDAGLIAALHSGEDLHSTVGSYVFGVPVDEVTAEMRRRTKAMSYGLAYGLSAYGLSQQLSISTGEAQSLMDRFFERFGGIRDYLTDVVAEARAKGYTESIFGRRRYLPDLNSDNRQAREMAERMALNAPIQGTAADIVKIAMLRVHAALAGHKSRLLLQVHDELVLEVAEGEEEVVSALVREQMQGAAQLAVPLDVSVGLGVSWAEAAH